MKLRKTLLAVTTLASLVSFASCKKKDKNAITVCLASEPKTIDPALNSAVDGATMLVHLESGLLRWVQNEKKDGLELVNDLAESITKATQSVTNKELQNGSWKDVTYPNGTRYTVKLKEGLKWSDGTNLTADDFIYSWNRANGAALGADYGYMFEPICNAVWNESVAEEDKGEDEGKGLGLAKVDDRTFTIDVMVDVPYFNQLLAFPTFFPVQKATVEKNDQDNPGRWALFPETYVSCGAYKLASWNHNSSIVVEKNPNYWNASNVTLEKITFALSDDDNAILASYNAGEYDMIDSVPNDQIDTLKESKKDEFVVAGQIGTYYVCFNVNSTKFNAKANTEEQRAKLRKALGLFIDRNYIVKEIGKLGQVPANSFVPVGMSDPAGGEFTDHNGENGDGKGYYNKGDTDAEYQANVDEGIRMLKDLGYTYNDSTKKFTDFPTNAVYLYNNGTSHKQIAEFLRDTYTKYGITLTLQSEVWASFLESRKQGNFDIARNGWVADYDDPSTFLSMWTTQSGNNDCQLGKGAHASVNIYSTDVNNDGTVGNDEKNLTWANSYDKLNAAAAKEADPAKRFKILHNQETLLMSTGAVCPIYFYTDLYMIKPTIKGFYSSPLGYKYFLYCTVE